MIDEKWLEQRKNELNIVVDFIEKISVYEWCLQAFDIRNETGLIIAFRINYQNKDVEIRLSRIVREGTFYNPFGSQNNSNIYIDFKKSCPKGLENSSYQYLYSGHEIEYLQKVEEIVGKIYWKILRAIKVNED